MRRQGPKQLYKATCNPKAEKTQNLNTSPEMPNIKFMFMTILTFFWGGVGGYEKKKRTFLSEVFHMLKSF